MLTLTISDPSSLTVKERAALVHLFSDAIATPAPPPAEVAPPDAVEPIVMPVNSEITSAREPGEPLRIEAVGPLAELIDPADNPETGKTEIEIPRFAPGVFIPPAPDAIDAAVVFGGTKPSVPVPPAPPATAAVPGPPSVPAATAGVPPAGVDLDSRGFPWDHRIHASTKGKNADGAWKKRKNVEPELTTSVEAELRALMSAPVVPPPPGAVPTETPTTFAMLMDWVTKMVAAHKLTQADVVAAVTPYSLQSVIGLGNRPDLVPQVHAALIARVDEIEANAARVTP